MGRESGNSDCEVMTSIANSLFDGQWAICAFLISFIALAMAELGSAMPTSGGLYYWTFYYSAPGWKRLLSWIVGCMSSVSFSIRKHLQ